MVCSRTRDQSFGLNVRGVREERLRTEGVREGSPVSSEGKDTVSSERRSPVRRDAETRRENVGGTEPSVRVRGVGIRP